MENGHQEVTSNDVVYCDNCLCHRSSVKTVSVKFFLCTCRHILCVKCLDASNDSSITICPTCKQKIQFMQIEKLPPEYGKLLNTQFIQKTCDDIAKINAFRERRLIIWAKKTQGGKNGPNIYEIQQQNAKMKQVIQQMQGHIKLLEEQFNLTHKKLKAYEQDRKIRKESFSRVTSECEALRRENKRLKSHNSILSSKGSKSVKQTSKLPSEIGLPMYSQHPSVTQLQQPSQTMEFSTVKTPLSNKNLYKTLFNKTPSNTYQSTIPGSAGELYKKMKASHIDPSSYTWFNDSKMV